MLLAEIAAIGSSELAARWAQDAVPRKNSLTQADAKLVEEAFERRMSELPPSEAIAPRQEGAAIVPIAASDASSGQAAAPQDSDPGNTTRTATAILQSRSTRAYFPLRHPAATATVSTCAL
jgi:hypothetical protein